MAQKKKPIPIKRPKRDFRAIAIKRLKQRYEAENEGEFDPSGQHIVTPSLQTAGIAEVLAALRAYDDSDARDFIELYDSISKTDLKYLKLEEIAVAAGITSLRLAEISTSAMIVHGQMEAKLCLASAMGKVVRSVVKAATDQVPITADIGDRRVVVGHTNGDTKAMELFGKMTKLVPVPKGVTVNFGVGASEDKEDDERETPAYMDAGQRLRAIHDAVDQRRLPAPVSGPFQINSRVEHMQTETAEIIGSGDVF